MSRSLVIVNGHAGVAGSWFGRPRFQLRDKGLPVISLRCEEGSPACDRRDWFHFLSRNVAAAIARLEI